MNPPFPLSLSIPGMVGRLCSSGDPEVVLTALFPTCAAGRIGSHRDDAQDFDNADNQRYEYRDQGDVQIIVELTDWFDKSPPVGAKHQDAISGIREAHARQEQRREDHDVHEARST